MIIEQTISETRVRHYSDEHRRIRQVETGIVYDDAVDNVPCQYTYEETDEPIPPRELDAQEALDTIFGGGGV